MSLSPTEAQALLKDWRNFWGRPEQVTPDGVWLTWLILAGRGWGKTRTGAEDLGWYGLTHPKSRLAIVAATYADARDTCVEGESGILKVLPADQVITWNRSLGEIILKNETRYKLYSAEKPDRIRGPNLHRAWCDELAAWKYLEQAWAMLMMCLRAGDDPRVVVTTTPRPIKLIKQLLAASTTHYTYGRTDDNLANLAPSFIEQVIKPYKGTRLGRQELDALILDDTPGALWKLDRIDALRVEHHPDLVRIVVAVDPSVSSSEESAETGIIVAGKGTDGHGYVLEDCTLRGTPLQRAAAIISAYTRWQADAVIVEVNNGGDWIPSVIHLAPGGENIHIESVRAMRGKQIRAEPVSGLYEQGRYHHVGFFGPLEDQLTTWTPGDKSPDRLDALVWGATSLFDLNTAIPLRDEPMPDDTAMKTPSIQELMQQDPFEYARTHGMWDD